MSVPDFLACYIAVRPSFTYPSPTPMTLIYHTTAISELVRHVTNSKLDPSLRHDLCPVPN